MSEDLLQCARKYAIAFLNVHPHLATQCYEQQVVTSANALTAYHRLFLLYDYLAVHNDNSERFVASKLPPDFKKLIQLLIQQRRIALLPAILEAIVREIKKRTNTVAVRIESSQQLQAHEQTVVINFFARKINATVEPTFLINSNLIAGLRMISDNFLWERSVARRLHELKIQWSR